MRIYRLPGFLRLLYPEAHFSFGSASKNLYLTFDDGPTDGVTQSVLEVLDRKGIPATFFVSGRQVQSNFKLFESVRDQNHAIGNHGFEHLNGFRTETGKYLQNVDLGAEVSGSKYFRPPYGKIRRSQYRAVIESYSIVFWSLMPYDFDHSLSESKMLAILKRGVSPGTIIVLHDNKKTRSLTFLDDFIAYCKGEGYCFEKLPDLI